MSAVADGTGRPAQVRAAGGGRCGPPPRRLGLRSAPRLASASGWHTPQPAGTSGPSGPPCGWEVWPTTGSRSLLGRGRLRVVGHCTRRRATALRIVKLGGPSEAAARAIGVCDDDGPSSATRRSPPTTSSPPRRRPPGASAPPRSPPGSARPAPPGPAVLQSPAPLSRGTAAMATIRGRAPARRAARPTRRRLADPARGGAHPRRQPAGAAARVWWPAPCCSAPR